MKFRTADENGFYKERGPGIVSLARFAVDCLTI
jgi:hypothetical protein